MNTLAVVRWTFCEQMFTSSGGGEASAAERCSDSEGLGTPHFSRLSSELYHQCQWHFKLPSVSWIINGSHLCHFRMCVIVQGAEMAGGAFDWLWLPVPQGRVCFWQDAQWPTNTLTEEYYFITDCGQLDSPPAYLVLHNSPSVIFWFILVNALN